MLLSLSGVVSYTVTVISNAERREYKMVRVVLARRIWRASLFLTTVHILN